MHQWHCACVQAVSMNGICQPWDEISRDPSVLYIVTDLVVSDMTKPHRLSQYGSAGQQLISRKQSISSNVWTVVSIHWEMLNRLVLLNGSNMLASQTVEIYTFAKSVYKKQTCHWNLHYLLRTDSVPDWGRPPQISWSEICFELLGWKSPTNKNKQNVLSGI